MVTRQWCRNILRIKDNKGKFVVTERFTRISKNKIYKYMTSIFKNVYINKLDDIVNEYSDTYHRTIQMKPIDVKSNIYIDFNAENNVLKVLNLKLVIMQKYQNMKTLFQKFTLQIGLKKILWLKKLKILCRGHMQWNVFGMFM